MDSSIGRLMEPPSAVFGREQTIAETIEYEPRPVWTTPGAAPTRGA